MSRFQRYLFGNVLRTLLAIVGGLVLIALLTTGLTQIDLIIENHQTLLVYLWASALAAPQIVSLMMPIALFIATAAALNTAHRENEIVVAQAAGLSNWSVASPVMRLAVAASIVHLLLNLWIQPAAYREMRHTVTEASADLAASLVRQGQFTQPAPGLTTFARDVNGAELHDLLVQDSRNPDKVMTYIAKTAVLGEQEGLPVIIMQNGHAQWLDENRTIEILKFQQSPFDLAPFMGDQSATILKDSDRYLPELFYPDLTNYYDNQNMKRLLSEGHARIAAPLLNIAMALIAIYAVLGGDFSRRGYAMRIGIAATAAVVLRLTAFMAASAAQKQPSLNVLQYIVPVLAAVIVTTMFIAKPKWLKAAKLPRREKGPRVATGATPA